MEQDQLLSRTPRTSESISRSSISSIETVPERGQLYIKIIEARKLSVQDKNTFEDAFVKIKLNAKNMPTFKTRTFSKSNTPKWNEEFIMTVPNRKVPLRLKVYGHNILMANKKLGFHLIDLTSLANDRAIDAWYPLEGANGGEIRVVIRFSLIKTTEKKLEQINLRLTNMRVVLEKIVWYPGETMKGSFILNVGMPKKIRSMRLELRGVQEVNWSETFGSGDDSYTETYNQDHIFFSNTVTLCGEKKFGDPITLGSGTYIWPFAFTLPHNIPPSFRGGSGSTNYTCRVHIDIPWASDKIIKVPFDINVVESRKDTISSAQIETRFKEGEGSTKLKAQCPRVSFVGNTIKVDCDIDNSSTKVVTETKISILRKTYYLAEGHSCYFKTSVWSKKLKDGFPLLPNTLSSKSYLVGIPANLPPSLPKNASPLINIRYSVRVTLKYKGTDDHFELLNMVIGYNGKTKLKLPIFISEVYPAGTTAPIKNHEHVGILRVFTSTCYHPPPAIEKIPEDANVWLQNSVFESCGGIEHLKKLPLDVSNFMPPTVEKYIADPPHATDIIVPLPHKKSSATLYHGPFLFSEFRKPSSKMTVTIVDHNKPPSPPPGAKDPAFASAPSSPKEAPQTFPFAGVPRRNSISTDSPLLEKKIEVKTKADLAPSSVPSIILGDTALTSKSDPIIKNATENSSAKSISLLAVKEERSGEDKKDKKKSRLSSPRKVSKPKHTRSKSETNVEAIYDLKIPKI